MEDSLTRARESLSRCDRVVVLTGAGISAESGVPTFRGREGLWRRYRPEELATPQAFARDPRLVWEWYAWRRDVVAGAKPNAAHRALAAWSLGRSGIRIVTQNVDGLHADAAREAAGGEPAPQDRPIELHGSLFRERCTACGVRRKSREAVDATSLETLPRCPCGALLRPDVVWFGERLDPGLLAEAVAVAGRAQACLVVGTSAVVEPAAGVARIALQAGAALIEVNPEPTPLTSCATASFRGRAVDTIPQILPLLR